MRFIDADKLKSQFADVLFCDNTHIMQTINSAPTIEAEPVKHGRWEQYKTETVYDDIMGGEHQFKRFRCSLCGYDVGGNNRFHYCPNCGAKMNEVEE